MSEIYTYDDVSKLIPKMEETLKKGRYIHTIGVMHTAFSMAIRYDYPVYNAMMAGLLHDCAKCMPDEEKLKICKKNKLPLSAIEIKNPQLLHGKVGAFVAKKKYSINDDEILHAITYHTTGCPDMSLLDKIIYIADYIEPQRGLNNKQPRLNEIRKMAFIDIDQCLRMILEDSVEFLSHNPENMDEMTLNTYKYYVN